MTSLAELTAGTTPTDATADGGPPDADGATDAGPGTADSSTDGPWCTVNAPDAFFCTAFERTDLAQFQTTELDDATLTVDTTTSLSPPYSLLATAPQLANGTATAHGYLETRPSVSDVTVELGLRLEQASSGTEAMQIAKLVTTNGPLTWETGLALEGTSRRLFFYHYNDRTGVYAEPFSARPQPVGDWSTLRLHLKLAASGPGTVDLDIDGTRVATGISVPSPPSVSSTFGFYVGAVYVRAPHSGWTLRMDNVVLDSR